MDKYQPIEFPKIERIDGGENGRLYRTPSGNKYPSITTVLSIHNKEAILAWRKRVGAEEANKISSRAARRGTHIHTLAENHIKGKEVTPHILQRELWEGFKPLVDKIGVVHALESQMFSDRLQVAGTVDCVGYWEDELSIIDFKTSSRVKSEKDIHSYFMQEAAYACMFYELTGKPVKQLVTLMAVEDNEPLVFVQRTKDWLHHFIGLRNEYRNMTGE